MLQNCRPLNCIFLTSELPFSCSIRKSYRLQLALFRVPLFNSKVVLHVPKLQFMRSQLDVAFSSKLQLHFAPFSACLLWLDHLVAVLFRLLPSFSNPLSIQFNLSPRQNVVFRPTFLSAATTTLDNSPSPSSVHRNSPMATISSSSSPSKHFIFTFPCLYLGRNRSYKTHHPPTFIILASPFHFIISSLISRNFSRFFFAKSGGLPKYMLYAP